MEIRLKIRKIEKFRKSKNHSERCRKCGKVIAEPKELVKQAKR